MKKILVYGETEREARNFYPLKPDLAIGHRSYADYDNGETCDEEIFVDESKIAKKGKVKK